MAISLWEIPFGKHKGPIEDAPSSYLGWLLEQEWFCEKFKDHINTVEKELSFRERFGDGDEPEEDRTWNRRNK